MSHYERDGDFLGRVRLGDYVPLHCETLGGTGIPAFPTAVPTARIFDSSSLGAAVETVNMTVLDRFGVTGLFWREHRLGSLYSAAKVYAVFYEWTIGGSNFGTCAFFETIAGGDNTGNVIGAGLLERPEARQVVYQLDGGNLVARRNPR